MELSRASISRLALKVSDDADLLKRELMKIESVLTKNKGMNQKLKDETIKVQISLIKNFVIDLK